MNRSILFAVMTCLLVSACSDDKARERAPSNTGYSAYIQALLSDDGKQAFVGATLYQDGNKITLVAGDMIVARQGKNSVALKGAKQEITFYSGWLPLDDPQQPVEFDIEYQPITAREDRWYPADVAYVDNGPGRYVGELSWSMTFPQRVLLSAPAGGTLYSFKEDLITIQWNTESADVDKVRINASLECLKETKQIYSGSNSGEVTITVEDLFRNNAQTAQDILANLLVQALTLGLASGASNTRVTECDVDIYVVAESEEELGPPFSGGSIVASQSDNATIRINLTTPLEL